MIGTPTTVGASFFTVEARNSTGQRATKSFLLRIDPPALLVITKPSDQLAPGTVGIGAGGPLAEPVRPDLGHASRSGYVMFTARVTDESGAQATRQLSITIDG